MSKVHSQAHTTSRTRAEIKALTKWQAEKPELFVKRIYNQPGLDTVVAVPDGTSLRLDLWDRFKSDPVDNPKLVEKFVKGFSVRSAHSEMLQRSVRNGPFQDLADRDPGRRHAISLTPAEAEDLRSTMLRAPRRRGIALDPEEAARIAWDLGE